MLTEHNTLGCECEVCALKRRLVLPSPVRTAAEVRADAMAEDRPREAIRRANWHIRKGSFLVKA